LGVEAQNVDDAVHEVFLVVQRRLPEFDGAEARLTTWLYEIALRVAHRYRGQVAKEARRSVSIDSVSVDSVSTDNAGGVSERHFGVGLQTLDAQAEVELSSRIAFAQRALEVLDRDKREVFVLAFVEQRSAPEIAQITRAPLNTVYSRIRAAKRLFAAEVERLAAAGEELCERGVKP
jgi:RNA polymerase sigma-70 factor (ECF subfamily)